MEMQLSKIVLRRFLWLTEDVYLVSNGIFQLHNNIIDLPRRRTRVILFVLTTLARTPQLDTRHSGTQLDPFCFSSGVIRISSSRKLSDLNNYGFCVMVALRTGRTGEINGGVQIY